MSRIEDIAEESGMTQYVAANNKYLERFATLLLEEVIDKIYSSDPNDGDKTAPHEPYLTIVDNIAEHFFE